MSKWTPEMEEETKRLLAQDATAAERWTDVLESAYNELCRLRDKFASHQSEWHEQLAEIRRLREENLELRTFHNAQVHAYEKEAARAMQEKCAETAEWWESTNGIRKCSDTAEGIAATIRALKPEDV